jgi:hypothetical protein
MNASNFLSISLLDALLNFILGKEFCNSLDKYFFGFLLLLEPFMLPYLMSCIIFPAVDRKYLLKASQEL